MQGSIVVTLGLQDKEFRRDFLIVARGLIPSRG
ncbi:MAG: hypothetical protein ACI8V2_005304 [Candidatus Latescibacterota bacterium]|jgi:hypothetical protein